MSFDITVNQLYEENSFKIKSIRDLLSTLTTKQIIIDASKDAALINAMTRVLKEEFKKDYDLTFYLLSVYKIFSSFSELQYVVIDNKIGDILLKILEQEEVRMEKIKSIVKDSKVEQLERKQWRLVELVFQILYDLSANLNLEVKMVSRDILTSLSYFSKYYKMNATIVRWLIKLSLVQDNREDILSWELNFNAFLKDPNEEVLINTLMLLNNLFLLDTSKLEPYIAEIKALYTVGGKEISDAINGIIYNLFMSEKETMHSQFHEIIIGKHLVEKQIQSDYAKINLQLAIRNCSSKVVFANSKLLMEYCDKAMIQNDLTQWHSLINLSENAEIAKKLSGTIPKLIGLLQKHSNSPLGVAVTSVLSNLSYFEEDGLKLVKTYQLNALFPSILGKCISEDPFSISEGIKSYTIAIVGWIASLSRDVKIAEMFAKSSIQIQIMVLVDYYTTGHEKTLIFYAIFQFLMVPAIRSSVLSDSGIFLFNEDFIQQLIGNLSSSHPPLELISLQCLEMLYENSADVLHKVRFDYFIRKRTITRKKDLKRESRQDDVSNNLIKT